MPQMLSCRYTTKGGQTQVQPLRNNNGAFVPFGNPYTPVELSADAIGNVAQNLVVQFGPKFYCSAGREMRAYNPATQNWDLETALSDSPGRINGIYIGRGPTGALRAATIYFKAANILFYRTLDTPGGVWSGEVNTGLSFPTIVHTGTPGIVHNNQIHFNIGGRLFTFDFATGGTTQQILSTTAYPYDAAFCRAKNRLFCAAFDGTITSHEHRNIYEFSGGSWAKVVDGVVETNLPAANASGFPDVTTSNAAMYYDEVSDSLILHSYLKDTPTTEDGWHVARIPLATLGSGVTQIQGTVVPGGFAYPTGPAPVGSTWDSLFVVEVDQDTNPTAPVVYVWRLTDDGAWGRYLWNGVGAAMTALGNGGNRGIALSHNPTGGGQYFYDGSTTLLPAYNIEEAQARVALPGATRVFLRGSLIDETGGVPTPTDETVGLYWGKDQPQADHLATILNAAKVSGPGSAPGIVGNKITGFTFDNTTIYSVEWQAAADGLANQDLHALVPHVEI